MFIQFCLLVLCSETAPDIAPDWKEVFNNKDEHNKEVFCNIGEQQFSLFLLHFSWYTIFGDVRARNFSVAAYHTSLHQANEDFKVRVYFIPILPKSSVAQQVRFILIYWQSRILEYLFLNKCTLFYYYIILFTMRSKVRQKR